MYVLNFYFELFYDIFQILSKENQRYMKENSGVDKTKDEVNQKFDKKTFDHQCSLHTLSHP